MTTKKFELNVQVNVTLPCYCGESLGINAQANQKFETMCPTCGSSYKCESNGYGQIDVTGVNISDKARDKRIIAESCSTLGIDPTKLSVRNGRAMIDISRFAQIISDSSKAVDADISMYAQTH